MNQRRPIIPGWDPQKVLPPPYHHVLAKFKDTSSPDIFIAYREEYKDGNVMWNPVGDIGENCYFTNDIEWWAEIPIVEVES